MPPYTSHHQGPAFTPNIVANIRRKYGLIDRFGRYRAAGWLTLREMADLLGVGTPTIKKWRRKGFLRSQVYNAKGERLYQPPGADAPMGHSGQRSYRPAQRPYIESRQGGAV